MISKIQLLFSFFCLFLLFPQISFSQTRDTLLEKLVLENNIQSRECYHTVITEGKKSPLSLLTSKMNFDSLGRPVNYTTYVDSVQISSFLVYFYDSMGNLIKSEVREKDKLGNHTVVYKYDKENLKVSEHATVGDKGIGQIKYLYNENNLLQKQEMELVKSPPNGPKRQSISYTYNQKNQLTQSIYNTDFKSTLENEFDDNGNLIFTYFKSKKKPRVLSAEMEYDEQNQQTLNKTYEYKNRSIFDGVNNFTLGKGDETIWIKEYFETGLLASEQLMINDVLVSVREYEYLQTASK